MKRIGDIVWVEAKVVPTCGPSSAGPSSAMTFPECIASCSLTGPSHHTWRIAKRRPRTIEILQLFDKNPKNIGLRVEFPDELAPFAYICRNETRYRLFVLSVGGVAYIVNLDNISSYPPTYNFTADEFLGLSVPGHSPITCVTAKDNSLAVGCEDGSVFCFRSDQTGGFRYMFDDECSYGRVKDLAISEYKDGEALFVLHLNGYLKVWDLKTYDKIASQFVGDLGTNGLRMWVGPAEVETGSIPRAILHKQCSVADMVQSPSLHRLHVFLQENCRSNNIRRAMDKCDSIEWELVFDSETIICPGCEIAVQETDLDGIKFRDLRCCKECAIVEGGSVGFPTLNYLNWEFNGVFTERNGKYKFKHGLCWLFTLTDQIEAHYSKLYPGHDPIILSKQHILDYIPVAEKVGIGDTFPYKLAEAYEWAIKEGLVLQKSYKCKFMGCKQMKRDIIGSTRVTLGELRSIEGNDEAAINSVLSEHPVACSMKITDIDAARLRKNPCCPFWLSKNNSYKRHAVVLSGKVTYNPACSLDSYLVREAQGMGIKGRFFIKKESALLEGQLNGIATVVYPSTINLVE